MIGRGGGGEIKRTVGNPDRTKQMRGAEATLKVHVLNFTRA